jgi:hypothetical protein
MWCGFFVEGGTVTRHIGRRLTEAQAEAEDAPTSTAVSGLQPDTG